MKPSIAITLIIMGSLLIMTPALTDHLRNREYVKMVVETKDDSRQLTFTDKMSSEYRFGCWGVGALMIGISVVGSISGIIRGKKGIDGSGE